VSPTQHGPDLPEPTPDADAHICPRSRAPRDDLRDSDDWCATALQDGAHVGVTTAVAAHACIEDAICYEVLALPVLAAA